MNTEYTNKLVCSFLKLVDAYREKDIKEFEAIMWKTLKLTKVYEKVLENYNSKVNNDTKFRENFLHRKNWLSKVISEKFSNVVKIKTVINCREDKKRVKLFAQSLEKLLAHSTDYYCLIQIFSKEDNLKLFEELNIETFSTSLFIFNLDYPFSEFNVSKFVILKRQANKDGYAVRLEYKKTESLRKKLSWDLKLKLQDIIKGNSIFEGTQAKRAFQIIKEGEFSILA